MTIQQRLIVATLLLLSPAMVGYVFPEQLWGLHFLNFLDDGQAALFIIIGAVALWVASSETSLVSTENSKTDEGLWNRLRVSLSLLAGAFVLATPLVVDVYGDSFSIIPHFSEPVESWTREMTLELLNFDLTYPKIGEQTFYSVSFLLSYVFGTTPIEAVKYLELVCFMLSIYFWSYLVTFVSENLATRAVLTLSGIVAPFALVYHAHTEMYVLPFTFILGYLALSKYVTENGFKTTHIILLWVALFLGLKFHIFCALLLPLPLMITIGKIGISGSNPVVKSYAHWGSLLLGIVVVTIAYFFITDSANGTRVFTKDNLYDAVFLPLKASEGPPLDRYNLLSASHLTDYLNMVFLWGTGLWIVVFLAGERFFSMLRECVFTKGLFLSFSAFALVFFILNPLLGMSADWDLFFFPALLLMPLLLEGFKLIEPSIHRKLTLILLLLTLLNLPLLMVHLNQEKLSERLAVLGQHEFKTYWKGSSSTIKLATDLQPIDKQAEHLGGAIESLRPFAIKGLDNEFAELLRTLAIKNGVQPNEKLQLLEEAYVYSPYLISNIYDLGLEYSRLGAFSKARPLVIKLVQNAYPDKRKSISMGIYVHLMLGEEELAKQLCQMGMTEWKDEPVWKELYGMVDALDVNRSIELIRQL